MQEKLYTVRPEMGEWAVFELTGINRARPVFKGTRGECDRKVAELRAAQRNG